MKMMRFRIRVPVPSFLVQKIEKRRQQYFMGVWNAYSPDRSQAREAFLRLRDDLQLTDEQDPPDAETESD